MSTASLKPLLELVRVRLERRTPGPILADGQGVRAGHVRWHGDSNPRRSCPLTVSRSVLTCPPKVDTVLKQGGGTFTPASEHLRTTPNETESETTLRSACRRPHCTQDASDRLALGPVGRSVVP
jgi:hypothetical protein